MAAARSLIRIAVNVVLDGMLAAAAVPLARWIADPALPAFTPCWTLLLGTVMLLVAGLPFRLSVQYWRFAGIDDLMGVVASSALGAVLFVSMLTPTGVAAGQPRLPRHSRPDPDRAPGHPPRRLSPLLRPHCRPPAR